MRSVVPSPFTHFGTNVGSLTRCLIPLQAPAGFQALQTSSELDDAQLIELLSDFPCHHSDHARSNVPSSTRIAQLGEMLSQAAASFEASQGVQAAKHTPAGSLSNDPASSKASILHATLTSTTGSLGNDLAKSKGDASPAKTPQSAPRLTASGALDLRLSSSAPPVRTHPYSRHHVLDLSTKKSHEKNLRTSSTNWSSRSESATTAGATGSVGQQHEVFRDDQRQGFHGHQLEMGIDHSIASRQSTVQQQHESDGQVATRVPSVSSSRRSVDKPIDLGPQLLPAPNSRETPPLMTSSRSTIVSGKNNQQTPSFASDYRPAGESQEQFNRLRTCQAAASASQFEPQDLSKPVLLRTQQKLIQSDQQSSFPRSEQQWAAATNSGNTSQPRPLVKSQQVSPNTRSDINTSSMHQQRMMSGQGLSLPTACQGPPADTGGKRVSDQAVAGVIASIRKNRELMALGNLFARWVNLPGLSGTSSDESDADLMLGLFGCVLTEERHGGWLSYAFAMRNDLSPLNAILMKDMQGSALTRFFDASVSAQELFGTALSSMPNEIQAVQLYFELVGRMYLAWKENRYYTVPVSTSPLPNVLDVTKCFENLNVPTMQGDWTQDFPVVSLEDYHHYIASHMTNPTPRQCEFRAAMSIVFALLADAPDKRSDTCFRFLEVRFKRNVRRDLRRGLFPQALEQLLTHEFIDVTHLTSIGNQDMPPETRTGILLGLLLSANVFAIAMDLNSAAWINRS